MTALAILMLVNCSEPRLQFIPFFEKVNSGIKYPGAAWEDRSFATRRALDAVASYADYAEAYRDKCGASR